MLQLRNRLRLAVSGLMMVFAIAVPVGILPAATHASNDPNGNNGTLKVHEQGTPSGTESNDPKVCAFNLEGFGFDSGQTGYIMIDVQGGDGPTGVSSGPYPFGPTNDSGYGVTPTDGTYFNGAGGTTIQNGHYKATLYGKDDNGQLSDVKAKSKVFKVDCAVTGGGSQTGTLTVIKHVVGGTLSASDFSIHVKRGNGDAPAEDVSGSPQPGSETGTTYDRLNPGNYFVSEDAVSGYTGSFSGDCDSSGKVMVDIGGAASCTLTNTFSAGHGGATTGTLTVIKHVINDNGGTADAADFTMAVNGNSPSLTTFPGSETGTTVTLSPGTYTVGEGDHTGYAESLSSGCSGTIAAGQSVTCTITNNDIATSSGTVLGSSTGPGQGGAGGAVLGASTGPATLPQTGSSADIPVLAGLAAGAGAYWWSRRRLQRKPRFSYWEL